MSDESPIPQNVGNPVATNPVAQVPNAITSASVIRKAAVEGKPMAPMKLSYNTAETYKIIKERLDDAKIPFLRISITKAQLIIELPGNSDQADDVAKLLVIPGVFGVKGVTKKSEVMEVSRVRDNFNIVNRTILKLNRSFASLSLK